MSEAAPGAGCGAVPRHVAIIMDGNGRWAQSRFLPRSAGHRAGVAAVRMAVEECKDRGVEVLSVFAFSSENWRRPPTEVGLLMGLLVEVLEREIDALARNGVRVRFIGDRGSLAPQLAARMTAAEERTAGNSLLTFVIAIAYGGRWDILQATRRLAARCAAGELPAAAIDEASFAAAVETAGIPDPDLFIRTGGERRISNFLLWNLAYTELWFTDVLWPDFDRAEFGRALDFFAGRNRRFGLTQAQLESR
jgi:undecaprenyl diphosphate synthase